MSATVAAALKKIAVAILTDKKALKKVGVIILVIVIVIAMPVVAVLSIIDGGLKVDTDLWQEMILNELTEEERQKLLTIETTMQSIQNEMTARGFDSKIEEAQVLYILALYDYSGAEGFTAKLVDCFIEAETDAEIVSAVNSAFESNIATDDFTNAMSSIRMTRIDTLNFYDITTKNNIDIVNWASQAENKGWGYVEGTCGAKLDEQLLGIKISQYPIEVGEKADLIRQKWLGKRTADSAGLIKGYIWYDAETKSIRQGTNGLFDITANEMFENAEEMGEIETLPEIPGIILWRDGCVGVYVGNDEVVHSAGTEKGVIRESVSSEAWTNWFKLKNIEYVVETEQEVI